MLKRGGWLTAEGDPEVDRDPEHSRCAGVFSVAAVHLCLASKSERGSSEKIQYGS